MSTSPSIKLASSKSVSATFWPPSDFSITIALKLATESLVVVAGQLSPCVRRIGERRKRFLPCVLTAIALDLAVVAPHSQRSPGQQFGCPKVAKVALQGRPKAKTNVGDQD